MFKNIGVNEIDGIEHFHVAPLRTRRDMAMLGIIHRALLGVGPDQFRAFFRYNPDSSSVARNRHGKQIVSYRRGKFLDLLAYSMLGAADVYNLLPEYIVEAPTTKEFQHRLQELAVAAANNGMHDWQNIFSPRQVLHVHTVRDWFEWRGRSRQQPVIQTIANVHATRCVGAWLQFGNT